jgi:hypothetical protein
MIPLEDKLVLAVILIIVLIKFLFRQELKLPPPPAGVIKGKVAYPSDTAAIAGVTVALIDNNGAKVASDLTLADGSFTFGTPDVGIPAGMFTIEGHKDLTTPAGAWLEGSEQITSVGGETDVADITLVNEIEA